MISDRNEWKKHLLNCDLCVATLFVKRDKTRLVFTAE